MSELQSAAPSITAASAPTTHDRPRDLWWFRIPLLLGSILFGFVLLEFGLRYHWFGGFTIPAGIEDSHFHHRLKPNWTYHFSSSEFAVDVRTNRYGLRGPDPMIPKPTGVFRILMLGDSFTFGFPVEDDETFCHLIEAGLRERGYPVEVVNGGVSGSSPTLHYLSLRDQFLSFEPDLVILWFDLGDVQEDHWFQKNLVYDARGRIVRCDSQYRDGRFNRWAWCKTHSALAAYVDRKILRTFHNLRVLGPWAYVRMLARHERAKIAIAKLKSSQQAKDLADSDRFLLVRDSSTDALVGPYWALTATYLMMIRDELSQRGTPFMLGMYPYGMLVGPDQWSEGRGVWGFERGKTYSGELARSLLGRFAASEHIPLIDTVEGFRAAQASAVLFYPEDGHFTPAGQRVLASYALADPQLLKTIEQQLHRLDGSR